MYDLRQFQADFKHGLYKSWDSGSRATIGVLPTGAGKTVIMSDIAKDVNEPTVAIAHKKELVQQICMAMAGNEMPHNIIATKETINTIISQQILMYGQSFYDSRAQLTIAGIGSLNRRSKDLVQWANTVRCWLGDEGHHYLAHNQWGKGIDMFPNAHGIGFTASPIRCDRKSLHRIQGGVYDDMHVGASMRDLINQGYLCDYRLIVPPQSINTDTVKISQATGDFSSPSLRQAAAKSTITGDIVEHYQKFASGKRGITFVVDVDSAIKTAQLFNDAGVNAQAVSAKTPQSIRNEIVRKFRDGKITQLVNVDLFGEGFDVPGVEVVSMGRPTQSLGLYIQQFGRALRILDGKEYGIIIDHVGNVKRHGLPDAIRGWSLDAEAGRRSAIRDPDIMPVTSCVACFRAFEAITKICPFCGHIQEPESRAEPKFVDGDLIELSPEVLNKMRAEVTRIDGQPLIPSALVGTPAQGALVRRHGERQVAQIGLRDTIALWAGVRRDKGQNDSEIHRRFYHTFNIDVLSAQALKTNDAIALQKKIQERYWAV